MDFNVKQENGLSIVSLSGRLDAVTAPVCDQHFRDLVDSGALCLVVNLETLDYISSAGLRTLLMLAKLLKEKNGKVCLASPQPNVRSVFEMSGFLTIFQVCNTLADAVQTIA